MQYGVLTGYRTPRIYSLLLSHSSLMLFLGLTSESAASSIPSRPFLILHFLKDFTVVQYEYEWFSDAHVFLPIFKPLVWLPTSSFWCKILIWYPHLFYSLTHECFKLFINKDVQWLQLATKSSWNHS
jgi:hypothetical protein